MILNFSKPKTKILLITLILLTTIKSEEVAEATEATETAETAETPTETASADASSSTAPETPKGKKCNLTVIKELGLQGVPNAMPTSLFMCPSIKSTCCAKEDQITLYDNWVTKKESHNLKSRFEYHESVYNKYLTSIEEVYFRAIKMAVKLEEEKDANKIDCLVISRRIGHYQLSAIITVLKSFIKKMHHFYRKTYKGVYCAICDGESNGFINEAAMEVDFSKKFCRDIVQHSLTFLIYFHVHVPKLSNLMSKFLVSCDREGVYKKAAVPPEVFFNVVPDVAKSIEDCKQFRNDKDWFEYCGKVCGNFNMVEFSKYFQPNLEEFTNYEVFLRDNIKRIDTEGTETEKKDDEGVDKKVEKVSKKTNKESRVLEEEAEKTEETEKKEGEEKTEEKTEEAAKKDENEKKDENAKPDEAAKKEEEAPEQTPAEKFANLSLFLLKEGSPIINIKPTFKNKGISLYDLGEAALINEKTLEMAKNNELPAAPVEEKEAEVKTPEEKEAESVVKVEVSKKEGAAGEKNVEALEAPEAPEGEVKKEGVRVFEGYVVLFLLWVFG